jgi:putative glycosyltransferase (TIGR04372 family)
MGDTSMQRINLSEHILDYSHYNKRDDLLDVVLCAGAKLYVGSESGLLVAASLFGTPIYKANSAPLTHLFPAFGVGNVGIPKLYEDSFTGKILTLEEVFKLGIANLRSDLDYDKCPYKLVSNTPDDIRDLVVEGLEKLDGTFIEKSEDIILQEEVKRIFRKYSIFDFNEKSKVGTLFLRKYKNIIF